jgi:hypothetical protein
VSSSTCSSFYEVRSPHRRPARQPFQHPRLPHDRLLSSSVKTLAESASYCLLPPCFSELFGPEMPHLDSTAWVATYMRSSTAARVKILADSVNLSTRTRSFRW